MQKADQRLVGERIAAHPVGDHANAVVLAADLGDQQQVADAARAGVDVDVRWQHRYQHFVGIARHLRQLPRLERRRGIDDHVRGRLRNAQLERSRGSSVFLIGCDDVNQRLGRFAFLYPAQR